MLMQSCSVRTAWKTEVPYCASGRKGTPINEKKAPFWTYGAAEQFRCPIYSRQKHQKVVNSHIFINVLILAGLLNGIIASCKQPCQYTAFVCVVSLLVYPRGAINRDGQSVSLDLLLFARLADSDLDCSAGRNRAICCIVVSVAVFTVRALYAGTLVTCWTTAPSHRPCRSLSALLAILATLTITARCYASTNATHPLVQLNPHTPRPIKFDSNAQHSSKIVLSRLYRIPRNVVQSDTRIISTNSKDSLYNQTFNVVAHLFRRKRQTNSTKSHPSNTYLEHPLTYNNNNNNLLEDDPKIRTNEIPAYPPATDRNPSGPSFSNRFRILRLENSASDDSERDRNFERRTEGPLLPTVDDTSEGASNRSANVSRVINTLHDIDHQNDEHRPVPDSSGFEGSMPPAHGQNSNSSVNEWGVLVLVVSAVVLTVALGLVTCVLNHYHRSGAGGTAALDPHDAAQTPTTAPMLSVVSAGAAAGVGGMDRLRGRGAAERDLAATRDHQVRLHTVRTDIAINLPPSIAMPDGEEEHTREHAFTRLHIRDAEQESEILQKCIRPPPNRTVLESESPPPYRSSSAGLLGSIGGSSSGSSDWTGGTAPLVVRCHSMSSTSKRPETAGPSGQKTDFLQRTVKRFTSKKNQPTTPTSSSSPVVIVPSRPRRTSDQLQQNATGRTGKPSV